MDVWNREERERFKGTCLDPKPFGPAPGDYYNPNRWNKRTFNLKFLHSPESKTK